MERVSVEVWQLILSEVMETTRNDLPKFATSCTPYTFLRFTVQQTKPQVNWRSYLDHLADRMCLRLVCRTWNEFVLDTSRRWLALADWGPLYERDPTIARAKGGVGPVDKLSTKINSVELVAPILSWVSHILKRPAGRSPLRAYTLQLNSTPVLEYNPLDDLLVGTTTTQDPKCTNTNTTLRSLSIVTSRNLNISISLSQISRTFTGLRSLFLHDIHATPQQTLTLAHLEGLYVCCPELETLQESMEKWDTPALRHVFLGDFSTLPTGVLDRFLGRYAHQIESLVLGAFSTKPSPLLDLPSGFWAQFSALRLLGLEYETVERKEWSGWSIVPPPTHPCRYLVCRSRLESLMLPVFLRSRWTWHDGVRLVVGYRDEGQYCVWKIVHNRLELNTERNDGILPEF
jgi:hypothetical protein